MASGDGRGCTAPMSRRSSRAPSRNACMGSTPPGARRSRAGERCEGGRAAVSAVVSGKVDPEARARPAGHQNQDARRQSRADLVPALDDFGDAPHRPCRTAASPPRRSSSAPRSGRGLRRSRLPGGWRAGGRGSSGCTFTILGARLDRAGWRAASPCTPSAIGSGTPRSSRRAPT
jgi:hypothetical protein